MSNTPLSSKFSDPELARQASRNTKTPRSPEMRTCAGCQKQSSNGEEKEGKWFCLRCTEKEKKGSSSTRSRNPKEYGCAKCLQLFTADNVRTVPGDEPDGTTYCLTCVSQRVAEVKQIHEERRKKELEAKRIEEDRRREEEEAKERLEAERVEKEAEERRLEAERVERELEAQKAAEAQRAAEAKAQRAAEAQKAAEAKAQKAAEAQGAAKALAASSGTSNQVFECHGCDEMLQREHFPRRQMGQLWICKGCIRDYVQHERQNEEAKQSKGSLRRDDEVLSHQSHQSRLSKLSEDTKKTDGELAELLKQERAEIICRQYKAQEDEHLRCVEELRKKRAVAARLANKRESSISGLVPNLDNIDNRSMTGSERNETIQEWIETDNAHEPIPDLQTNHQIKADDMRTKARAYTGGSKWGDLERLERSVLQTPNNDTNADKKSDLKTEKEKLHTKQPTAEQIRIAQIVDIKGDNDEKMQEKVQSLMEMKQRSEEEEICCALHECDNDLNRAVNFLLESLPVGAFETSSKKKKNRLASVSNDTGGDADWNDNSPSQNGQNNNADGRDKSLSRGGMRGGRGGGRGKENRENDRNNQHSDSRDGNFRGMRGDRGGRGSGRFGYACRGARGGRMGPRTGGGGRDYRDRNNLRQNDNHQEVDTWDTNQVPTEINIWGDWDNEEYTGSLSDTKVFTPSVSQSQTIPSELSAPPGLEQPGLCLSPPARPDDLVVSSTTTAAAVDSVQFPEIQASAAQLRQSMDMQQQLNAASAASSSLYVEQSQYFKSLTSQNTGQPMVNSYQPATVQYSAPCGTGYSYIEQVGTAQPQRKPTGEVLRSALAQIENVLNATPLMYVQVTPDSTEALTPNHILLGQSNGTRPLGPLPEKRVSLTKQWQQAMDRSDCFWSRWTKEYQPTLTRRTKWYTKTDPVTIGDVGVLWETGTRNSWKLGRIVAIHEAKDGQVRTVEIKTATGIYRRPVSKFARFDIGDPDENSQDHEGGNVEREPREHPKHEDEKLDELNTAFLEVNAEEAAGEQRRIHCGRDDKNGA